MRFWSAGIKRGIISAKLILMTLAPRSTAIFIAISRSVVAPMPTACVLPGKRAAPNARKGSIWVSPANPVAWIVRVHR